MTTPDPRAPALREATTPTCGKRCYGEDGRQPLGCYCKRPLNHEGECHWRVPASAPAAEERETCDRWVCSAHGHCDTLCCDEAVPICRECDETFHRVECSRYRPPRKPAVAAPASETPEADRFAARGWNIATVEAACDEMERLSAGWRVEAMQRINAETEAAYRTPELAELRATIATLRTSLDAAEQGVVAQRARAEQNFNSYTAAEAENHRLRTSLDQVTRELDEAKTALNAYEELETRICPADGQTSLAEWCDAMEEHHTGLCDRIGSVEDAAHTLCDNADHFDAAIGYVVKSADLDALRRALASGGTQS